MRLACKCSMTHPAADTTTTTTKRMTIDHAECVFFAAKMATEVSICSLRTGTTRVSVAAGFQFGLLRVCLTGFFS
jgi:hypothetical protein